VEQRAQGEARQYAQSLRRLAAELSVASVGTAWRSPARDQCEAQLGFLEEQLRTSARRLELWADQVVTSSHMADML